MAKHLIVVHGRSIKPAEAPMKKLVRKALVTGLERADDASTAAKIKNRDLKTSLVYFGDISNEIQGAEDTSDRKAMTAKDPDHNNGPALPHELLEEAMRLTVKTSGNFTYHAYKKVLKIADDLRLLDDATSVISFFGAITTFGFLNEQIIKIAKPDMAAYLMRKTTGSDIRERLQKKLVPSIKSGDDIMLVTHSMGCMVAYDVFWKISFESEYKEVRDAQNPVRKWLTIGCPLAEPGVRKNLRDGNAMEIDKYPRNTFLDWINIWAQDDYIAHSSKMKGAFKDMTRKRYAKSITDKKIYNCWIYSKDKGKNLISNPHDLYGYLMSEKTGEEISKWARS